MSAINNGGGGGGGTVPNFADSETPTGAVDSANVTYTLAHTPNPAVSLELAQNGLVLSPGGVDFTLVTATITMVTAPLTGDILLAFYRY